MKKLKFLISFLLISCGLLAQSSNKVIFTFDHRAGSDSMVLGNTKFAIWNGKQVIIDRADFYISEIALKKQDGTSLNLSDQTILVKAHNPNQEFDLGEWQIEEINGLVMNLGVPASVNHLDPATYPQDHALAPQNPTMHWGWSAGYRFMAIEGRVDNNNDGKPETIFEFHNLGDALYKSLEVTGIEKADQGILHIHLILDYARLFQNMSMSGNLIQHGSGSLNDRMMTNGAKEKFISMPAITASEDVTKVKLQAYPNPASDILNIDFQYSESSDVELILQNNLGQNVAGYRIPSSRILQIPVNGFPGGNYMIAIVNAGGKIIYRQSVVINHR